MFPARAGMSPPVYRRQVPSRGVPRASGDEPNAINNWNLNNACSPRERG